MFQDEYPDEGREDQKNEEPESDWLNVSESLRNLRRKSAPVPELDRMLLDSGSTGQYHSVQLSSALQALDPELRKSLTKVKFTPITDPDTETDVIKNRRVGRDELEVYREKQMQRLASELSDDSALGAVTELQEEDTEIMAAELSSLIQRLEAVATRLEKVQGGNAASDIRRHLSSLRTNPTGALPALRATLDALEERVTGSQQPVSQESLSESVNAFDDILSGPFKNFIALSEKIGGDVSTQARMVNDAFKAQRQFLVVASKAKQPAQPDLLLLLKPTSDKISEIQSFRESNRRSQLFNHLSAISESIPALGWVTVSPAPAPFVKEMNDAGQFYTNRVLKDWKEKDKTHVDWVKAWVETLSQMQAFVKQHHTTGLVWNPKGGDAKSLVGTVTSAAPAAAAPAGGPPLPPPPPPPGLFDDIKVDQNPEKTARNALFAEINQGEGVTKGLKKVTPEMQTHKNPNLRQGAGPKPALAPKPGSAPSAKPVVAQKQQPPKLELDGRKWIVEFFKNNPNIEVDNTATNQSVYVYRCEGSTIKVSGKVNNIILDGCKKTAVVFDTVVSSVEFINCQSVQMQVLGKVPTISIDKTDGCQMFLSKDSLNTSLITAKSSEMNVMIPSGNDFVEQPVPEQFKTTIDGTKLKTTISDMV